MKIIKDLRILKRLSKKYNFVVDREFKYITKEDTTLKQFRELKTEGFDIKYLSGCFYPFVIFEEVLKWL